MTDNSASTICPVCQNVNSAEAVKCLRCSVTLAFVGIGVEPSPEPAEVKVNAGAALESACPHCGATSHAVGAIRCLWCKQLLAPGPELDVVDVVDEDEPSLTAKVCAVVLIVFAGLLFVGTSVPAFLLLFRILGNLGRLGVEVLASFAGALLAPVLSARMLLQGLRVFIGVPNSENGFYAALFALGLIASLVMTYGLLGGSRLPIALAVVGGGILAVVTVTAVAFARLGARVRQ